MLKKFKYFIFVIVVFLFLFSLDDSCFALSEQAADNAKQTVDDANFEKNSEENKKRVIIISVIMFIIGFFLRAIFFK